MATPETPRTRRTPRAKVASDGVPSTAPAAPTAITSLAPTPEVAQSGQSGYVVPFVHVHLSERLVNAGFWTVLAGSAALGVVDLPLAALIGGSVYVARHHARSGA